MKTSMFLLVCSSVFVLSNYEIGAKYLLVEIDNDRNLGSLDGLGIDRMDQMGEGKTIYRCILSNLNETLSI